MKKILYIVIALLFSFTLFSCNSDNGGSADTLKINVYAAGYGTKWIDNAVEVFKKQNPDVKVSVEASPLALDAVQTQLENRNCSYDVVLVSSANYKSFVGKGYLEDLTDLYDTKIVDSDLTVRECTIDELVTKYTVEDGKIYGVSWQPNYAPGFVYNKALFDEYEWEIPTTMDEFFALCDQIDIDTDGAVTPLTFGGADGNGYLYTAMPQWLLEMYGVDEMNEFYDLASPAVYSNQSAGRTIIYKTLAKLTKGVTTSGRDITLTGSVGATAITAQTNFVNGRCAMIVNGTWFPTEMGEYLELRNFKVGFIPLPHINSDKMDYTHTIDTSNVRSSYDNGVFAVPSSSKNKDLAKKFIASMYTSESYTGFIEACNGLNRFIKNVTVDTTSFNDFTKAAYTYYNANNNFATVLKYSRDQLIENDVLNLFFAYKGGYFEYIAGAKNYATALQIAEGCVANEYDYVLQKWDSSKNKWRS